MCQFNSELLQLVRCTVSLQSPVPTAIDRNHGRPSAKAVAFEGLGHSSSISLWNTSSWFETWEWRIPIRRSYEYTWGSFSLVTSETSPYTPQDHCMTQSALSNLWSDPSHYENQANTQLERNSQHYQKSMVITYTLSNRLQLTIAL